MYFTFSMHLKLRQATCSYWTAEFYTLKNPFGVKGEKNKICLHGGKNKILQTSGIFIFSHSSFNESIRVMFSKVWSENCGYSYKEFCREWCVIYCGSVAQWCLSLCNPMDCSTPGFTVSRSLLKLMSSWVDDAIQPFHPLLTTSPPALNLSQQQGLFQWVGLHIRWPKYWSFSFSIRPFYKSVWFIGSEYSGLNILGKNILNQNILDL